MAGLFSKTETIDLMYDKERGLYIAHCANGALSITGKMANRHGLIAGATGTGKTVTLQVMAETFCQAGVPCFMADMKGDLSGISQVGKMSGFIEKRMPEFGIENPDYLADGTPAAQPSDEPQRDAGWCAKHRIPYRRRAWTAAT